MNKQTAHWWLSIAFWLWPCVHVDNMCKRCGWVARNCCLMMRAFVCKCCLLLCNLVLFMLHQPLCGACACVASNTTIDCVHGAFISVATWPQEERPTTTTDMCTCLCLCVLLIDGRIRNVSVEQSWVGVNVRSIQWSIREHCVNWQCCWTTYKKSLLCA